MRDRQQTEMRLTFRHLPMDKRNTLFALARRRTLKPVLSEVNSITSILVY